MSPKKSKSFNLLSISFSSSIVLKLIVSNCNSGWKMTPVKSNEWMEQNMFPFYPLGDIKVNGEIVKQLI